jgi:hypothetical protein
MEILPFAGAAGDITTTLPHAEYFRHRYFRSLNGRNTVAPVSGCCTASPTAVRAVCARSGQRADMPHAPGPTALRPAPRRI